MQTKFVAIIRYQGYTGKGHLAQINLAKQPADKEQWAKDYVKHVTCDRGTFTSVQVIAT